MGTYSLKSLLISLIVWATCSQAQVTTIYGPFNLTDKTFSFTIDSARVQYALPDSFIFANSETVYAADSVLTPAIDYKLNYVDGVLLLKKQIPVGEEITLQYRIIPFELEKTYFRRKLVYQGDSVRTIQQTPKPEERSMTQRSSLQKSGSIVRGISLGTNQGLKVESGLRMNLSGKITENVEVVAALTDQTTPIQPEGNTQTLNEIDKVFVELKSDHFNATLGDYYLTFEGSEFGRYNRKLQGAMGTASFKDTEVKLSGAVSKGQYTTNRFLGQEGNQGPYQLRGINGEIDIIVLAGTEKVWIDGELLTRGENNDYVIEYSIGQIMFTRKRLITAESRIVVDFQYSDLQFRRNLYSAKTTTSLWDDKLNLDFRLIHEADNKDNPLDFTLSDENLQQLKSAGDNIDSAYISGVNYAGPGKGYYTQVDSAGLQFYQYVGKDSGDYNIGFSYVGSGNGDYRSVGFGNYKFVGDGNGSYRPVLFLKPAQSHDVADMSLNMNFGKGLSINSEFAASRFDRNTYSGIDDGDNSGIAHTTSLRFQPERLSVGNLNLGKILLDARLRVVDSKFRYIDRAEAVEKNRKWDSDNVATNQENIREFSMDYQPVEHLKVAAGLGYNAKGDRFDSRRWDAETRITFSRLPKMHYRAERIESDNQASMKMSNWLRHSGQVNSQLWKFHPMVAFSGEDKKETFEDTLTTGFKYDEFTAGLELNDFKKMSLGFTVIQREDQQYEQNRLLPYSNAMTYKSGWNYSGSRNFSASLEYTHREKQYDNPELSATRADLGDAKLTYSPLDRALTSNWHYQISNTQVAKKERVYLKVAQGEGNYRFNEQTNEYEPDDLGDYVLRIQQTDEFIPVVELRASTRLQFTPKRLFKGKELTNWRKWLSAITSDTYIRLEEKTEEKDVWSIYRLDMSKFQQPDKTIFGNNSIRQDIYLFQNNRDFSVRFRLDTRDEVNFQFLDGGNIFDFNEKSIRVIYRISNKLSSQLDGSSEYKSYDYTNRTDKFIRDNNFALDFSFRPKQIIEFALKSKIAIKRDEALTPFTEANEFSFMPRANYSFRDKGKLRVEFEWTNVEVRPKNRIIPFELVGINRAGATLRWLVALNYNISRYVRATLSYNGRQEPDRPDTIHLGRAEVRAYF